MLAHSSACFSIGHLLGLAVAPGVQFPCFLALLALLAGPIPAYPLPKSSLGKPISTATSFGSVRNITILPLTTTGLVPIYK